MTSTDNRFIYLLAGLLVALLVTPVASERSPEVHGLMLTLSLLICTFSMSTSKRIYVAAWFLVAAKMLFAAIVHFHPNTVAFIAESVVLFAFFLLAVVFSLGRVLQDEYVDLNRIAGAISVYMMLGLIWSSMYFFVFLLEPAAFGGLVEPATSEIDALTAISMDLVYYSYVTLSTLGYGDITPVGRIAQSLSYLEAICGVMYVAVLVAALVGSYGKNRVVEA